MIETIKYYYYYPDFTVSVASLVETVILLIDFLKLSNVVPGEQWMHGLPNLEKGSTWSGNVDRLVWFKLLLSRYILAIKTWIGLLK